MTTAAFVYNLAWPDLVVVSFIVLLLFGARKLPNLASGLVRISKKPIHEDPELFDLNSELTAASAAIFLAAILIFCAKLAQTT